MSCWEIKYNSDFGECKIIYDDETGDLSNHKKIQGFYKDVLLTFLNNPNVCISHDDINSIYGGDSKKTINYIRTAIGCVKNDLIETIYGQGYKFIGKARKIISQEDVENAHHSFTRAIKEMQKNVRLSTKGVLENNDNFSISTRMAGVSHITLVNYAGTSFISSIKIAGQYSNCRSLKDWFETNLINGFLDATIILTNPRSHAAYDAACYKMYPAKREKAAELELADNHRVILGNITDLLQFKKKYPKAKIKLKLTDIALPWGAVLAESEEYSDYDSMKVDIYSPLLGEGNDRNRPSFFLNKFDSSTNQFYHLFYDVIKRIEKEAVPFEGPDISWLCDPGQKAVIHRGRISNDLYEHSLSAYWECLKRNYPMEVDVLFLKDGTALIGREALLKRKSDGQRYSLKMLSLDEIRSMYTEDYWMIVHDPEDKSEKEVVLPFRLEELLTMQELLNLVNGKVPLMIELKNNFTDRDRLNELALRVVDELRYYEGKFAIHSANFHLLKLIRSKDELMPLGQISWSFQGINESREYLDVHRKYKYLYDQEFCPDFISYKIEELDDSIPDNVYHKINKKNIPLISWTVKDIHMEERAKRLCHNYVIEGGESFASDGQSKEIT